MFFRSQACTPIAAAGEMIIAALMGGAGKTQHHKPIYQGSGCPSYTHTGYNDHQGAHSPGSRKVPGNNVLFQSKRQSPYKKGRSGCWSKRHQKGTVFCVVTGFSARPRWEHGNIGRAWAELIKRDGVLILNHLRQFNWITDSDCCGLVQVKNETWLFKVLKTVDVNKFPLESTVGET